VRVGHLPAGCVSHLLLAKKRGLFEKAGVHAQITQFNGPAENILALQSGKLDLMHNPWTTTFAAYAAGSNNLQIVGGSGQAGIELVARSGSVKNVNELIKAAGSGLRIGTLHLDTLELVTIGTLAMHGKSYKDYALKFFRAWWEWERPSPVARLTFVHWLSPTPKLSWPKMTPSTLLTVTMSGTVSARLCNNHHGVVHAAKRTDA
jgi:hypothetical protein